MHGAKSRSGYRAGAVGLAASTGRSCWTSHEEGQSSSRGCRSCEVGSAVETCGADNSHTVLKGEWVDGCRDTHHGVIRDQHISRSTLASVPDQKQSTDEEQRLGTIASLCGGCLAPATQLRTVSANTLAQLLLFRSSLGCPLFRPHIIRGSDILCSKSWRKSLLTPSPGSCSQLRSSSTSSLISSIRHTLRFVMRHRSSSGTARVLLRVDELVAHFIFTNRSEQT